MYDQAVVDDETIQSLVADETLQLTKKNSFSRRKVAVLIVGVCATLLMLLGVGAWCSPREGLNWTWHSSLFARLNGFTQTELFTAAPRLRMRWRLPELPQGPQSMLKDFDPAANKRFAQMVAGASSSAETSAVEHRLKALSEMVSPQGRHLEHEEHGFEMKYAEAACVGTILTLAYYIGWVGLNIDAMVDTCPPQDGDVSCSSNAVALVSNLAWIMVNAAQMPEWCVIATGEAKDDNKKTEAELAIDCIVSMSFFVASGTEVAMDGIASKGDCGDGNDTEGVHGGHTRRLKSKLQSGVEFELEEVHKNSKARGIHGDFPEHLRGSRRHISTLPGLDLMDMQSKKELEMESDEDDARAFNQGVCAVGAIQAGVDTAYIGIDVWALVEDCVPSRFNSTSSVETKEDCAASILGVISDFPNFAGNVATLISSCPVVAPKASACVADWADLASTVLGLGAWASSVNHACGKGHHGEPSKHIILSSETSLE